MHSLTRVAMHLCHHPHNSKIALRFNLDAVEMLPQCIDVLVSVARSGT